MHQVPLDNQTGEVALERRVRLRAVVANMAAAVVLAAIPACSVSEPAPSSSASYPTAAAASAFSDALAKARATTPAVSDAQIKALEKAVKSGEMSYEEISALLEDTFACFDESGVSYRRTGDYANVPGFKMPTYSFGEPVAVADACQNRFSEYAFEAYQSQPKVAELRSAAFQAERLQVLACLRKLGAVLDDNATDDEMLQARNRILEKDVKDGVEFVDCSTYWW